MEIRPDLLSLLSDLERASLSGDRDHLIEVSRKLRRLMIDDPSLLAEVESALNDSGNGLALRRVIAVVLGSLPDATGKGALVRALRSGAVSGMERSVLLALNMVAEEAPPIFRRDGHPFAEEAAPGLVVFVRGSLDDPDAREAANRLLASPESDVRLAAARVLRDSMNHRDTRDAMRGCLAATHIEDDEELRAESAAALAHWTKGGSSNDPDRSNERGAAIEVLLGLLSNPGEIVHLRLASPLAQTPLDQRQLSQLRELAAAPNEDVRRTAIEILGRRIPASGGEGVETIPLLTAATESDPSPNVRETGALSLRYAAGNTEAAETLARAVTSDHDPEVRAAAAISLASFHSNQTALDTLITAQDNDPSELVRAAARRALGNR